jgi:hypothetical protein
LSAIASRTESGYLVPLLATKQGPGVDRPRSILGFVNAREFAEVSVEGVPHCSFGRILRLVPRVQLVFEVAGLQRATVGEERHGVDERLPRVALSRRSIADDFPDRRLVAIATAGLVLGFGGDLPLCVDAVAVPGVSL